jgi:hypothetical protein
MSRSRNPSETLLKEKDVKLNVFDTYVIHDDGKTMHFDVLLPQEAELADAEKFALHWLNEIGMQINSIQVDSCRFCHTEPANPETENIVASRGYAILQMEGCPSPIY